MPVLVEVIQDGRVLYVSEPGSVSNSNKIVCVLSHEGVCVNKIYGVIVRTVDVSVIEYEKLSSLVEVAVSKVTTQKTVNSMLWVQV